jgi:hypothetical protein
VEERVDEETRRSLVRTKGGSCEDGTNGCEGGVGSDLSRDRLGSSEVGLVFSVVIEAAASVEGGAEEEEREVR